jgi:putative FmdB family regulatory protein
MPIYEFECKKCGKGFEILMGFNEKANPRCPECGSKKTKRLLSSFSTGSSKRGTACGPTGST